MPLDNIRTPLSLDSFPDMAFRFVHLSTLVFSISKDGSLFYTAKSGLKVKIKIRSCTQDWIRTLWCVGLSH